MSRGEKEQSNKDAKKQTVGFSLVNSRKRAVPMETNSRNTRIHTHCLRVTPCFRTSAVAS